MSGFLSIANGKCQLNNSSEKWECGENVGELNCKRMGCCYDESSNFGFSCFGHKRAECGLEERNLKQCGFDFISRKYCERMGCCYEYKKWFRDGDFLCFHSKSQIESKIMKKPECEIEEDNLVPCGSYKKSSRNECERVGCCSIVSIYHHLNDEGYCFYSKYPNGSLKVLNPKVKKELSKGDSKSLVKVTFLQMTKTIERNIEGDRFIGYLSDLINIMVDGLKENGYNVSIDEGSEGLGVKYENSTYIEYSNIYDHLYKCKADIAISSAPITFDEFYYTSGVMSSDIKIMGSPFTKNIRKWEYSVQFLNSFLENNEIWIIFFTTSAFLFLHFNKLVNLTDFLFIMFLLFMKQGIPENLGKRIQLTFIFISIAFLLMSFVMLALIGTTLIIRDVEVVNTLDDIRKHDGLAFMVIAHSGAGPILEFLPIMRRSMPKIYKTEQDNAIGLFELSDPKYETYFRGNKMVVIGEDYLLNFMALTQCQNKEFKYHISKEPLFTVRSSFLMSKCIDPNVRRIFDKRTFLGTDYGLLLYSMEQTIYKVVPKLLLTDLDKCKPSAIADDILLVLEDFHYFFLSFFILFASSAFILFCEYLKKLILDN